MVCDTNDMSNVNRNRYPDKPGRGNRDITNRMCGSCPWEHVRLIMVVHVLRI